MSLESAEKLVERILRQLGVDYRVEEGEGAKATHIVADVNSLSALPPELHPYVTAKQPAVPQVGEASEGSKESSPRRRS